MNNAPLGFNEFGFWLAVALVVIAFIWAGVTKQRMKHELTLKLLEKGQGVDPELLAKLLSFDKPGAPVQPKSAAERRRHERGAFVFVFLMVGLLFAFFGMVMRGHTMQPVVGREPLAMWVDTGPNWPLVGLGIFCFVFGCWSWVGIEKEYQQAKAEEKLLRD